MKTVKLAQIKKGDRGSAVLLLQVILSTRINGINGKAFYTGELDSAFGPITEKAVKDYQSVRLKMGAAIGDVDGICGEKTWYDLLGLPEA
jgi:peptidoglycan hydrolase-like protein with peptidoglycan-binding domain